jgi:hypothetical protein
MKLCECGCGQTVTRVGNRFISGHNTRVNHPKGMLGKISKRRIDKIITICKNCGNEIKHQRSVNRVFCNRKCKSEWMSKQGGENCPNYQGGKEKFICEYCGEEFENHLSQLKNHKFCNKECYDKWQSINKTGENSPTWKGGLITKVCEICNKEFETPPSGNHRFCCNDCRAIWVGKQQRGENHPGWKGGISNQKYCVKFNNQLKIKIRDKYNNCDYISGIHKDICNPDRELSVHHVNYNKQCGCDGTKCKLIPLCGSNHLRTNTNRLFWNRLFIYSLEYDKTYYEVE